MGILRQISLTDEEIDRLLEKLDMLRGDADAQFLAGRIYQQQISNPSDIPYPMFIPGVVKLPDRKKALTTEEEKHIAELRK